MSLHGKYCYCTDKYSHVINGVCQGQASELVKIVADAIFVATNTAKALGLEMQFGVPLERGTPRARFSIGIPGLELIGEFKRKEPDGSDSSS